jgi:hypothetical protein
MTRVLAAFLTGLGLSAIVLVVRVIRHDVVDARAILGPFTMAPGRSATAGPPVRHRPDEKPVLYSPRTPSTAPSLIAPHVTSNPPVWIAPSRPPSEVSPSPAQLLKPFRPPSNIASISASAITPSSSTSAQPAKPMPTVMRPVSGVSTSPAPSRRTRSVSIDASPNHKPGIAPKRSIKAKATAGPKAAVGLFRVAPTQIWDCRPTRGRFQCAKAHY